MLLLLTWYLKIVSLTYITQSLHLHTRHLADALIESNLHISHLYTLRVKSLVQGSHLVNNWSEMCTGQCLQTTSI